MDFDQFRLTPKELKIILKDRSCTGCGACCRGVGIELHKADLIREPQLLQYATSWTDIPAGKRKGFRPASYVIETHGHACPFLADNRCRIYPTRPEICRKLPPSFAVCQMARLTQYGMDAPQFIADAMSSPILEPPLIAGILFAINPDILKKAWNHKDLVDVVDIEYFKESKTRMMNDGPAR